MAKYKKKTVKNKFYKGTQEVTVPQTMTNADVGASALSGAAAGAAMGSAIMPGWGTAIGGVAGGAIGAYKGVVDKDKSIIANKNAKNLNQQAFKDANTSEDNKLQNYQFKKGTKDIDGDFDNSKVIEIEGKEFPEIHTDKNYKIKTLGIKPHTEGGTKTVAAEGDIVFNTQDNKKDYKKVISDISLYKLKGDKNAFKRLEKRRKEMPDDKGNAKKRWGSNGEWIDDNVPEEGPLASNNRYTYNNPNIIDSEVLDYQNNQLTVSQNNINRDISVNPYTQKPIMPQYTGTQYNNTLNKNPLFNTQFSGETSSLNNQGQEVINPVVQNTNMPVQQNIKYTGPNSNTNWGNTNFSGNKGYDPTTDKFNPVNPEQTFNNVGQDRMDTNTATTPKLNAVPTNSIPRQKKELGNIGRYADIAYNAIQAFNTPKEPYNLKYRMDKYKYTDVSDPLRNAAIQNRSTQLSNAGKAGTSIGQQLSYGQQAQNQYVDQLGKINANETERKQNVQNANVDLSNQENQVNYSRAITNNDIQNQRLAKQQAFGATAVNEFANINEANNNANILSKNQKEINNVSAKRDDQYLNLFSEKNFKITPELKAEYVKSGSTKSIATWAAEDYKVFAKGTSGINTKKTSTYSYKTKNK